MTDYPEDIMKAARLRCDLAGVTPHSDMRVHCEVVAAGAILAERKRCAEVARNDDGLAPGGNMDFGPNVARRIASAIMGGSDE